MRIVVEVRSPPQRLPGRPLLPVAGIPLAVLAALRAGNGGHQTVLAASRDPGNDSLCAAAIARGLKVVRGAGDDGLALLLTCAGDLADDDIVVRFTDDDVVPDGDFAAMLADGLAGGDGDILGTAWPEAGLPFGVRGEAIRVGALRRFAGQANAAERQLPTAVLWRLGRVAAVNDLAGGIDTARYRCAVVSFADYVRIKALFAGIADPITVPWRQLVERLAQTPEKDWLLGPRPAAPDRAAEFVLGTVQIGLPYGTLRKFSMPDDAGATSLLHRAAEIGVRQFDTARNYGRSEERVGDALAGLGSAAPAVVTKLDPFFFVPADAPEWAVRSAVQASVFASCRALRTRHLPVLLLHLAHTRTSWNGAAWRCLLEMRDQGIIGRLGISVQNAIEAEQAIGDPDVEQIQLPANILDHRWRQAGIPALLAERPDIVVHARSVFLQGVLLSGDVGGWPARDPAMAQRLIDWLQGLTRELGLASVAHLLVGYLRSLGWIHGLVLGVENEAQLAANMRLFEAPLLSREAIERIEQSRPHFPDWLLDPGRWKGGAWN
ncbi:aryl-alcohol dehydrogenase-like predicted oxidoreductase [Dongia mobilis]|uniref:Aryl-alcohol dehydrogenase-like predicted oxidoreductase n=1 Tax=Dongia mobilis TaxID=578943 RepID=A0A4R6WRQ0_9PROT|nr:aldo/keto reductase [Dongia mobilis]TDQ84275.1 aryl-alcohol dehydrogenase-like predicted oxidoreductase [Dongia mobilis]